MRRFLECRQAFGPRMRATVGWAWYSNEREEVAQRFVINPKKSPPKQHSDSKALWPAGTSRTASAWEDPSALAGRVTTTHFPLFKHHTASRTDTIAHRWQLPHVDRGVELGLSCLFETGRAITQFLCLGRRQARRSCRSRASVSLASSSSVTKRQDGQRHFRNYCARRIGLRPGFSSSA